MIQSKKKKLIGGANVGMVVHVVALSGEEFFIDIVEGDTGAYLCERVREEMGSPPGSIVQIYKDMPVDENTRLIDKNTRLIDENTRLIDQGIVDGDELTAIINHGPITLTITLNSLTARRYPQPFLIHIRNVPPNAEIDISDLIRIRDWPNAMQGVEAIGDTHFIQRIAVENPEEVYLRDLMRNMSPQDRADALAEMSAEDRAAAIQIEMDRLMLKSDDEGFFKETVTNIIQTGKEDMTISAFAKGGTGPLGGTVRTPKRFHEPIEIELDYISDRIDVNEIQPHPWWWRDY